MTDVHELYIKYAGDIYRFALYLSGDREGAQDITAETFEQLTISMTIQSLLYQMVKNRTILKMV